MQSHQQENFHEGLLQTLLRKQRNIEIKNNGISAVFRTCSQSSYLQIDQQGFNIMQFWLQERYPIIVYSANGWNQLFFIDRTQVYIQNQSIYLVNRAANRVLNNGFTYLLARNNATIQILIYALSWRKQIEPQLYKFINYPDFTQLKSNKPFDLEEWAYHQLNQSQKKAVDLVVNEKITFIKGPPGCGKTRLIARLATIFSYYGYPLLVGAVSNLANITILESMLKECDEMNYHPNIVLYIIKQQSGDNMKHPPRIRQCTFRYRVIGKLMDIAGYGDSIQYWCYLENMLDSYWKGEPVNSCFISMYFQAVGSVFNQAMVLIATATSSIQFNRKLNHDQKFKPYIGILDQASQASWGYAYCFLTQNIQKMVLIGDDKQLAPTVISQNQTLKQTIFTKQQIKNPKYHILLNTQYRMHPQISQFPNQAFYESKLQNGITAQDRKTQIQYFSKFPLSFINCEYAEQEDIQERSQKKKYCNFGEINIIRKILNMIPNTQYYKVGIIAPYDWHIKWIRFQLGEQLFRDGVTLRTFDGYQGSQKDYIIVSCVRSNKQGKIGFLSQQNRLNVALTRARKGLVLIGNKQTFEKQGQTSIWHKYMKYLSSKNLIREQTQLQEYKKLSTITQNEIKIENRQEIENKMNEALQNYDKCQVLDIQAQFW